eukprot:5261105-Alexandrium_andersonii.AAC.1
MKAALPQVVTDAQLEAALTSAGWRDVQVLTRGRGRQPWTLAARPPVAQASALHSILAVEL